MSRILVLDDDPHIVRTLEIMLKGDGHEVLTAASGEDALTIVQRENVDIALVDIQLPGMSGIDVLRRLKNGHRHIEVIVITAYGSIESAVESMKEGAFDYLTKPFSPDQVRHRLSQLERWHKLYSELAGLERRLGNIPFKKEFITQNSTTLHLLEIAQNVALSDATVLITGESGTGKTLLAKLIHDGSERKDSPFVTVDCTCFQESLLESELFGHCKGAFTGAISDKEGKMERANKGTLFLDEISEVPFHLQAKLLRFIDERTYERVGDSCPRTIDVRIIAATNRDLQEMVQEKKFREDLFYRLSVVDLFIPALRNRLEDILLLASEFITSLSLAHKKRITEWDNDVEQILLNYSWPGNIRELAHTIERAVLLASGRILRAEHLPIRLLDVIRTPEGDKTSMTLTQLEEKHIQKVLALNLPQEETANRLGIDPSTLWRKRKKYNI